MSAAAERWAAVLDTIERDVRAADVALTRGTDIEVSDWTPPTDIGPLPEVLRPRVLAVVEAITSLQMRGTARLDELGDQRTDLGKRRDAGAAYAEVGPSA